MDARENDRSSKEPANEELTAADLEDAAYLAELGVIVIQEIVPPKEKTY